MPKITNPYELVRHRTVDPVVAGSSPVRLAWLCVDFLKGSPGSKDPGEINRLSQK